MSLRRKRAREDDESEVNLTPMLDVVFIMLIFFIVTASFVKESGIDVNRPDAQTAEPKQKASILIAISEDGEIWIKKRRVDIRQVRRNALDDRPQRGKISRPVVRLRRANRQINRSR